MSARSHVAALAVLLLCGVGGLAWQLEQAAAADERAGREGTVPRLICPLH